MTGEDVKCLRDKLKLSQRELAEVLGVAVRTIANYEGGGEIPLVKQKRIREIMDGITVSGGLNKGIITGSITGEVDNSRGKRVHTNNYHGLSKEDLVAMIEERFRLIQRKEELILDKEEQIRAIFDENRRLTEAVMRQNEELERSNEDKRELFREIRALTKKLVGDK